jgi:nitrate reductase NapE component
MIENLRSYISGNSSAWLAIYLFIGTLAGHYRIATLSRETDSAKEIIELRFVWIFMWPVLEIMMNGAIILIWWEYLIKRWRNK